MRTPRSLFASAIASAIAFAVVAVAVAGCATAPPPVSPLATSLADAESAFAAASLSSGVKSAFLDAMDDQATLFRPGPVNGRTWIANRPEPPIVLEWRPQFVAVSSAGDLGLSTGPSRFTPKSAGGAPTYGQYFTVWKRDAQNRWVFLVDHGVGNDGPVGWDVPLEATIADGTRPIEPMMDAEVRFATMSANVGVGRAYRDFGSNAVRVLRDGAPLVFAADVPIRTSPLVLADSTLWTWTATDSGTAQSGDLGWVMGRYRTTDDQGNRSTGYFVRVWRSQERNWRILGDVLAPTPAPEPAR